MLDLRRHDLRRPGNEPQRAFAQDDRELGLRPLALEPELHPLFDDVGTQPRISTYRCSSIVLGLHQAVDELRLEGSRSDLRRLRALCTEPNQSGTTAAPYASHQSSCTVPGANAVSASVVSSDTP